MKVKIEIEIEIEVTVNEHNNVRVRSAKWPRLSEIGDQLKAVSIGETKPWQNIVGYCDQENNLNKVAIIKI